MQALSLAVLVVLFVEGILFCAGLGEQEALRLDPVCGFAPTENKRLTCRTEGFAVTQFNSHGMNDVERPFDKPAGTKRIAVIGDSLVEAGQVSRDKNFLSVLQRGLSTKQEPVEVLNCGASAYNIGQMYLRMRDLAMKFHPDVVLLPVRKDAALILVPNPGGPMIFARPTFYLDKAGKVQMDYSVQQQWLKSPEGQRVQATSWLRKNSRIWGVVSVIAGNLITWYQNDLKWLHPILGKSGNGTAWGGKGGPPGYDWVGCSREDCDKKVWPLADEILGMMNDTCKQNHCQFVILRFPPYDDEDASLETKLLAETAKKRGIPYVNMVEPFHAARERGVKPFYVTHLTPEGHQILGDGLTKFFTCDSHFDFRKQNP